jgi:hypothetical protein
MKYSWALFVLLLLECASITAGAQVRPVCVAGADAASFINGVGSTVPLQDLYPPNLKVSGTVGEKLAQPGTVAVSSLVGHDIYFNPANIKSSDYYFNLGTAFHEVLHNITGFTDPDLQRKLGLPEDSASRNITDKLIKDCL